MKKILLTTDFSENAWSATFTALKLYANVQCQFFILHAYEPTAFNLMGTKTQQRLGFLYDSLSKYSEQELEGILKYLEINHLNTNHHFTAISKSATLEEAVGNVVEENDIDLLLTGTQGATGAKEIFLGSNTVKMIKTVTDIPILAIPTRFNFQQLKTILFATDFRIAYKKKELNELIALASLWNAQIEVVHVAIEFNLNDKQKANKAVLKERLVGFDLKFKEIPFEGTISKSIDGYSAHMHSGLLAIIRHHHTFWEKVIGEPVVKKIAFHADIPVLFLPE